MNQQRRVMSLLGLCLLTAGCTRPIKNTPVWTERNNGPLSVSLRLFTSGTPEDRLVAEEEQLHNGDFIYFGLRVSQQAYLYVVLSQSDGTSRTLFPTADYQLAPAGCTLRVPAAKTLLLTEPAGVEDLRVVVSLRPLAEVDRGLCEELKLNCSAPEKIIPPAVAPCPLKPLPDYQPRGLLRSVKTSRADSNGIAQTRFSLRHGQ